MKKTALVLLAVFISAAYAVSIDFATFEAVTISDLKTESFDDGSTVEHSIEFSGPGLAGLMALLPEVKDFEGEQEVVVENMRMLSITNAGQPGVSPDKTTAIFFECDKENGEIKCSIRIIKGTIPG